MVEIIYDPKQRPVQQHRSKPHGSEMGPGDFEIGGLRWDDGCLVVANGPSLYLSAPVASGTLIDMWSRTLNGTSYLIYAIAKDGFIRMYHSTGGAALNEMTEVGGWHGSTDGNSRFATNTGRVNCCVIRAPESFVGGSVQPSRDVLLISNGTDMNRIWDPDRSSGTTLTISSVANSGGLIKVTTGTDHNRNTGDTVVITGATGTIAANLNGSWTITKVDADEFTLDGSVFTGSYSGSGVISDDHRLAIHHRITVPSDASLFSQKATFKRYWPVTGSSGKTYYAAGVVNQARFSFQDAFFDVYTGTNACIQLNWQTTAASGDIATFYIPNGGVALDLNKGLCQVTEDIVEEFGWDQILAHVKIEVNRENVAYNLIAQPWVTVWDPTSTSETQRRFEQSELIGPEVDLPRRLWMFPTDHLTTAERLCYHLRITRLADAPTPPVNVIAMLLVVAGAGDVRGASEWTQTLEDEPGRSESAPFVAQDMGGAALREMGGPKVFASTQGDMVLPLNTQIFYDYDLVIRNSDGASIITGGLNGEPSRFNLYLRSPVRQPDGSYALEATALYFYSVLMYTAGYSGGSRAWAKVESAKTIHHGTNSVTDTYDFDYTRRDIQRPAPSEFQIELRPAGAVMCRNGRVFLGDVLDRAGQRQRGDVYFTGFQRPFRPQAVVTSPNSGGRLHIDGEIVRGFLSSASGDQSLSHISVITDKWFYPLGSSGSGYGDPLDANILSVVQPAVGRGTNSPRSITERDGANFYLDNRGEWAEFAQGRVLPISRTHVDDVPEAIPTGRMDDVSSEFFKDKLYSAYTVAGGTTNTRVVGWDAFKRKWAFDDPLTQNAERLCVHYDPASNGTGLKLLLATQAGAIYQYEADAAAEVPVTLLTGDIQLGTHENPGIIDSVIVDVEGMNRTLTIDRLLRSPSGTYRTAVNLSDGWVTDENQNHTEVVAPSDAEGEQSRTAQLYMSGTLTSGKRIFQIAIKKATGTNQKAEAN